MLIEFGTLVQSECARRIVKVLFFNRASLCLYALDNANVSDIFANFSEEKK